MLKNTDIPASPDFNVPAKEILSRRTEYGAVFSLSNGRYQAILCGKPIIFSSYNSGKLQDVAGPYGVATFSYYLAFKNHMALWEQ